MEKRIPLALPPGFMSNGTLYQSKGRYRTGNLMRFFQGTIAPIGGWQERTLTGDTIEGTPRAVIQWTPEIIGAAQRPVIAVATTAGLYVIVENVVHDITPSEISSDMATRLWTLDTFGSYLVACATDVADYLDSSKLFVWTGDTAALATTIEEAPVSPTSIVVTDERFLFQLGGVDVLGPLYTNFPDTPSTRSVIWPSRERLTDWTPSPTNTAGSFPLSTNGKLLCGRRARGQTLLWTTTDMHAATFIGGEFVYRFTQAGDNCGAISINAVQVLGGLALWMGPKGFFNYNGFVQPIPCDVHDKVFGELNTAYQHLVWSFANSHFGEVTWFYPAGEATEPNAYVTHNYLEGTWVTGSLERSAGLGPTPPLAGPLLCGPNGEVYDHEVGTERLDADEEVVRPFLEMGPLELGEGDQVVQLQGLIPDETTLGAVTAEILVSMEPMGAETTVGPFTPSAQTDLRASGRKARVRYTEATPESGDPPAWKLGNWRLLVTPAGRR